MFEREREREREFFNRRENWWTDQTGADPSTSIDPPQINLLLGANKLAIKYR